MNKKIDSLENSVGKRIDALQNFVYLLLVLFGAMFALPFVNKLWEEHKAKTQSFTFKKGDL